MRLIRERFGLAFGNIFCELMIYLFFFQAWCSVYGKGDLALLCDVCTPCTEMYPCDTT